MSRFLQGVCCASCSFVVDSQLLNVHFLSSSRVVANSIPNIAKLIDESSSKIATTDEVSTIQQQEQMKCAMCKLIGSIATRKNPVVLFLDGKIIYLSRDSNPCYITKPYLPYINS